MPKGLAHLEKPLIADDYGTSDLDEMSSESAAFDACWTPSVKAQSLMALSSLLASLVSMDVSFLIKEHDYFHWSHVLLANGSIACVLCAAAWYVCPKQFRCGETSLIGAPEKRAYLAARGVLGALTATFANVALDYLPVGDASALMFCSPLFTGILSYLLVGQQWSKRDILVSVGSLVGVILVVRPGYVKVDDVAWKRAVGVACALGFAFTLASSALRFI